jgi:hypothetical protein
MFVTGKREEKVQELGCEADFRRVRKEMRKKEGGGVLVWNVNFSKGLGPKTCFIDG